MQRSISRASPPVAAAAMGAVGAIAWAMGKGGRAK
uniref:Uncharacterized protein n=1 Tax=Arundo donax TaxID=35708 RepID=A0A0A9EM07_ARUDO